MPLTEIIIKHSAFIPPGEVWCSYEAYEHIKKLLKVPDEVKLPTMDKLEKE